MKTNKKPFSLEWWLIALQCCVSRMIAYFQIGEYGKYESYAELSDWIEKRIIQKYGD